MEITEEVEERLRKIYKDEESLKTAREQYRKLFTLGDLLDGKCIRKKDDNGNWIWIRREPLE